MPCLPRFSCPDGDQPSAGDRLQGQRGATPKHVAPRCLGTAPPRVYVGPQRPADVAAARLGGGVGAPGSALSHQSALTIAGLGRPGAAIHIAVDRKGARPRARGRGRPPMCTVDAARGGGMRPPRVRVEHAVLDVAGEAPSEVDAIAVLADTVPERLTTASRLHSALDSRQWCSADG